MVQVWLQDNNNNWRKVNECKGKSQLRIAKKTVPDPKSFMKNEYLIFHGLHTTVEWCCLIFFCRFSL